VEGIVFNINRATVVVASALTILAAAPGRALAADQFVNPFIGFDFGGDAGCPSISNCEDKKLNAGVSFGTMGAVLGFEEEFAYAKNFFGDAPGLDSSVLTVMSNVMLVPNVGPIRPYALVGLGLIKTHVSLTPSSVLTSDNNSLGWDIGGGVNFFFSQHAGLRGDVRYFHSFKDLNLLGLTLGDTKLDFGRASVGLIFKF
jgi:opacity protein-like surface antigen